MTTALEQPEHNAHPLDQLVTDPSGRKPLCSEPEFTAILARMATNEAPRLFAVVQEYGDRVDARIAAWGMAFADHAEVVSVGYERRMSLPTPENALCLFGFGSHIRARLVWLDPGATGVSRRPTRRSGVA